MDSFVVACCPSWCWQTVLNSMRDLQNSCWEHDGGRLLQSSLLHICSDALSVLRAALQDRLCESSHAEFLFLVASKQQDLESM